MSTDAKTRLSPAVVATLAVALIGLIAAAFYGHPIYVKDRAQAKLNRIATAISRGEYDVARGLISSGLTDETDPKIVSELYLQRASLRLYSKESDWLPEAAKDSTKAVSADPSNLSAYRYRAIYSQMLGERFHDLTPKEAATFFKTAVEDYTTVIGRDSADWHDWIGRAKAYKALGESKKAEEDCRRAVELNPAARGDARVILPGRF